MHLMMHVTPRFMCEMLFGTVAYQAKRRVASSAHHSFLVGIKALSVIEGSGENYILLTRGIA